MMKQYRSNMEKQEKKRTLAQNRACHLLFQQVANTFIEHGITMPVIVKDINVYPSAESIKDIARAIGRAKYGKESTADWSTSEVNGVAEELHRIFVTATDGLIDISFPSITNTEDYLNSL